MSLMAIGTLWAGEWTLTYQGYPYKRTACDGPYYKSGTYVTLSAGKPVSAEGKIFQGWQYGTKIYQPGANFVMPDKDVVLVPRWKAQDEALDDIQSPACNAHKVLRDGQLIILRDGIEYDVLGNKIN